MKPGCYCLWWRTRTLQLTRVGLRQFCATLTIVLGVLKYFHFLGCRTCWVKAALTGTAQKERAECNSSHRRPEQRLLWAEWWCKSAKQRRRRHFNSLWLGDLLHKRCCLCLGQPVLELSFINLLIHFEKTLGNVNLFQFCSSSACVLSGCLLD